jgi:prevent-host-death family protein
MKRVALSAIKDQLSKYLRIAEKDRVLITRHGKPVAILIGFKDEDEWFEYQLENDPRFLERVDRARASLRAGKGVRLEDIAGDA